MSHAVSQNSSQVAGVEIVTSNARWFYIGLSMAAGFGCALLMVVAFYSGRMSAEPATATWNGIPINRVPPELLSATASHGGSNMAVCTAPVDENAEGFFALDYLTGDLNGWVYYPRQGGFGGRFNTNVSQVFGPPSKNPEFLLVSGAAASAPTGSNIRAAGSLLYVVDVKLGQFAAYTIPWNKSMESAGGIQANTFVLVGGDTIRAPNQGAANRKPPAQPLNPNPNVKPNNQNNNPADPNGIDPNNPNNVNPNNPNPNNPRLNNNGNRPKNPGNN